MTENKLREKGLDTYKKQNKHVGGRQKKREIADNKRKKRAKKI